MRVEPLRSQDVSASEVTSATLSQRSNGHGTSRAQSRTMPLSWSPVAAYATAHSLALVFLRTSSTTLIAHRHNPSSPRLATTCTPIGAPKNTRRLSGAPVHYISLPHPPPADTKTYIAPYSHYPTFPAMTSPFRSSNQTRSRSGPAQPVIISLNLIYFHADVLRPDNPEDSKRRYNLHQRTHHAWWPHVPLWARLEHRRPPFPALVE